MPTLPNAILVGTDPTEKQYAIISADREDDVDDWTPSGARGPRGRTSQAAWFAWAKRALAGKRLPWAKATYRPLGYSLGGDHVQSSGGIRITFGD